MTIKIIYYMAIWT